MHLVADVGGTKTLIAVADHGVPRDPRRYDNDAFTSFDALLRDYLATLATADRARLQGACLALATPVGGAAPVSLTNRPDWRFDPAALAAVLGGIDVRLVNDFVATASGIPALAESDLLTLQAGDPADSTVRLCVGPGTGFGVAVLAADQVLASEGGHVAFAPLDAQQADLWRFMGGEHRRVTVERLCSGPGLPAIHRYCRMRAGHALPSGLDAAEVVRRAREDGEPEAAQTLRLFVRILGAVAGDLALAFLARGGVYLAGGISPRLVPELQGGEFLAAFNDKSEHAALARRMPVHVVLRADLPLLGAARLALGADDGATARD